MHRYSIILSNNENIGPGHTLFSRISFKIIRERKLKKPKKQNKTAKKTQKIIIYMEQFIEAMTILNNDSQHDASFLQGRLILRGKVSLFYPFV